VTNEVLRGLGDFEMVKILDDPFDVVDLGRVYTGTWSCTFNALVIESGTWSTIAGAAPLSLATDLPMGTVCTLAEDASTLTAPPLVGFPQYIWETPVITPASVTILDGGVHRITVTNIVYDPISGLAHAGTDSLVWVVVGGGVLVGGILLVYLARRRRLA
jgi:LPXTG-motif cell wall-anchored protein